jgi:hypothetical protein
MTDRERTGIQIARRWGESSMSQFLDHARSTDLYRRLCQIGNTGDGNLLELTDDRTAEAQTEFLRWALLLADPKVVIETGTDKGLFGYLLSLVLRQVELHTFDIRPEAVRAVDLLNKGQSQLTSFFYEGDSRATLPRFLGAAQFAWLDGSHETDVLLSDFLQCYRMAVPFVAVDDGAYPSVRMALRYILDHTPYAIVPNPFAHNDRRQAMLLHLPSKN